MRQSRWAALLLCVVAAACTGGFTSGSIPDSVDRTLAALPLLTASATETGALPRRVDVAATATVDAASGRYRLTVRFPKLPPPGDPGAHAIELPRRYDVVVDGATVYVRAPVVGRRLDVRRSWLRAEPAAASPVVSQLALTRWTPYDPVAILQALRGVTGDLRELGEENLHGTRTTHFRGRLDTGAAVRAATDATRQRVAATTAELAARFGATSFPVDVWVDDDGLIRRVRFALGVDGGTGTTGRSLAAAAFTVDLAPAESPPTVAVPDPERVADVTNAAG